MPLALEGVTASLRWGYTQAAVLGAWSAVPGPGGRLTVTAKVVSQNTMRVAQRPLVFEARHAKGAWRWPVLELQVADGSLTAILGPHEG